MLKRRNVLRSLAKDELAKVFSQLADQEIINTLAEVYSEKGFQPALTAEPVGKSF